MMIFFTVFKIKDFSPLLLQELRQQIQGQRRDLQRSPKKRDVLQNKTDSISIQPTRSNFSGKI